VDNWSILSPVNRRRGARLPDVLRGRPKGRPVPHRLLINRQNIDGREKWAEPVTQQPAVDLEQALSRR
jgi:hypothetical protein